MAAWGRMLSRVLSRTMPVALVIGIVILVAAAGRDPLRRPDRFKETGVSPADVLPATQQLDAWFRDHWREQKVEPAAAANDLQILRRLSLALHGSNPSLQEIREFEQDSRPDRLAAWTRRYLADDRFNSYLAERLARVFVGADDGPFVLFRRDRFTDWLRTQLANGVPFDELVRQMIADTGLWTGRPQTNYVTATVNDGDVDENKLTGRTVRAFLGQRIDCAQCHDHPFEHWKQSEFEGLAAYFGQVRPGIAGLEDKVVADGEPVEYKVKDRMTLEERTVAPAVPFHTEWLPAEGSRRSQLAAWVTHKDNVRFERAIANRVWGLMFGRSYLEPVDDLPDPPVDGKVDPLAILGKDFRENGYDIRRLIQVIAASEVFRLASDDPADDEGVDSDEPADSSSGVDGRRQQRIVAWAQFPLLRLRPEQVIRSVLQCSIVQTVDQHGSWLFRLIRFVQERDFVKAYGDPGDEELTERGGTIPQRLLLMNGTVSSESLRANGLNSAGRISGFAGDDASAVEVAYLVCLTRRPSDEEREHFVATLKDKTGDERTSGIEDLFWALYNSTEFSWNH